MAATDPDELASISAELVAAIAEAQVRLEVGTLGDEYLDLLLRARVLHVTLLEMLLVAEPDVDEHGRGLAIAFGNGLDRLEAALRGDDGSSES